MEQSITKKTESSKLFILKYGDLSSLVWSSPLDLQPQCLKNNRIDREYCSRLKRFKAKQIT